MRIAITGSSGYIGSVLCKIAKERGHTVWAIDRKPPNHRYWDVRIVDDIRNDTAWASINCEALFHLAASADVTDSVTNPVVYYDNNVGATSRMLMNLLDMGWKNPIVFSSTAAVYGPSNDPLIEKSILSPYNAYGKSKLMCESVFQDVAYTHEIPTTVFRYFNVGGAYDDVGDHFDSHHILQKLCYSAVTQTQFNIYGTDWDTPDGTCIRDYLHVRDVCEAHFSALDFMKEHPGHFTYNLGTNKGVSVKQLSSLFKLATGERFDVVDALPRPGDPGFLVANGDLFRHRHKFSYKYSDIVNIIKTAWEFYNTYGVITCHSKKTKLVRKVRAGLSQLSED